MKQLSLFLFISISFLIFGCSTAPSNHSSIETGSAISGSFFADSSQFANSRVKLRIRDTSGDDLLNVKRLKKEISSNLETAGYSESMDNFGILIDVNTIRLSSVVNVEGDQISGLGTIIGGVLGMEAALKSGDITQTSGIVLGAVGGTAIESIIKNNGRPTTYVLVAEVNIGILKVNESSNASITIGESKLTENQSDPVYETFAMSDKLIVVAYGGGKNFSKEEILERIETRIARVISGII